MASSTCSHMNYRLMQNLLRKPFAQLDSKLFKRTAYFYCHSRTVIPVVHQLSLNNQTTQYSTRTSKAAIKAYHKYGLNAFVYNLTEDEREQLLETLQKASAATKLPQEELSKSVPAPTGPQLRYLMLFSGVPFIGFGLLDNTIMLTAGEYIDITFGALFGITTMAAAAIGNMISDVLGITTAGFVEQTAVKLGLKTPSVTLEQMSLKQSRRFANLGRCIGVCIGCILGMWPLLFYMKEKETVDSSSNPNTETPS